MEEYINGECDIPVWKNTLMENVISQYVATDFSSSDDEWEEDFLQSLCANEVNEVGKDSSEDEDDKMEEQDHKLKTYNEACEYLKDVQRFLESKGNISLSLLVKLLTQFIKNYHHYPQ